MELKKFKILGKEIEFVNQYRNTRMGFAHDTTLFVNGSQYGTATCTYYNRTWECYTYQTVMLRVVEELRECRRKWLLSEFKAEHGYQKMTDKRTAEFKEIFDKDEEVKLYRKITEKLNRR